MNWHAKEMGDVIMCILSIILKKMLKNPNFAFPTDNLQIFATKTRKPDHNTSLTYMLSVIHDQ